MAIKQVTKFVTSDGKEFSTMELATAHENLKENFKKEIKEDISKILIKLKDLQSATVSRDYDSSEYMINNEKDLEDLFLCSLKSLLTDISKSDYNAQTYLEKYYNSNCY